MQPEPNFDATKPSLKKSVYLALVVALGALFGFLVLLVLALLVIKFQASFGSLAEGAFLSGLVLGPTPVILFWVFVLAGAVGGFFVGPRWWQIIYVERRRWRRQS
jgi:hypothetical protein